MKKILLLFAGMFMLTVMVQAQFVPEKPSLQFKRSKPVFRDSFFLKRLSPLNYDTLSPKLPPSIDGMPVVETPRKFKYLGNNKKGFDIYSAHTDNMHILKPDSTFASNMPVAPRIRQQVIISKPRAPK